MDYYLRFDSEAAMRQAFGSHELEAPEGPVTVHPLVAGMALDIIGVISEPTGKTVEQDGVLLPVMQSLPGWHVNLRGESLPEGLEQYTINPTNPRRVWA